MKNSSISNSNSVILSPKEWGVTIIFFVVICSIIYIGWFRWEHFEPGSDYRPRCWAERMSDYWSHYRWTRYAQSRCKVALIGDSVFWGQEVNNDQTISHYLNEHYDEEIFANMGIDGLFQTAIRGLVKYYGKYYNNVILQFSPYWLADVNRDLRGKIKRFRHPRIVPQFHPRIHYNNYTLNERLSYKFEHYTRIMPLVRHLIVNYFENKSVVRWIIDNPYNCPFSAITFKAGEVMKESRGESLNWETKEMKLQNHQFIPLEESVQFECFLDTIKRLKKQNVPVFIILGPYNPYILTPESRERLYSLLEDIKQYFEENRLPYFEAGAILPSETYADGAGHMLYNGHDMLARDMMKDPGFREWLAELK